MRKGNLLILLAVVFLGILLSFRSFALRDRPETPAVGLDGGWGRGRPAKDPSSAGRRSPRDRTSSHPHLQDRAGGDSASGFRPAVPGYVRFSPPPGRYRGPVEVSLSPENASGSIRYTIDFTEPEPGREPYHGPVPIDRSAIFRARVFTGDDGSTRTVSATYIIDDGAGPDPLPTVSISLDPGDFTTVQTSSWLHGREAERPAFFEMFDVEGHRTAAAGFGMRLHGGAGRNGGLEAKKAYRAYFRKRYGTAKLRGPIIPDAPVKEFGKLVLRSGYNDRLRPGRGEYNVKAAYIRDQVIRDLHRDMGCPAAHGSWCLLYVNLEFRGLYNVVERLDEEFLSEQAGGKDWDVINTGEGVLSGSPEAWMELKEFLGSADLSREADFADLARRVDLENFTSYIILNLWAQNYDWPHNNWYAARKREAGGRWMFLEWDAEWGMGLRPWGYQADAARALVSNAGGGLIRDLFEGLIASEKYRRHFLEEVRRHLRGALDPERVLRHVHRQRDLVAPVMEREIETFFRSGGHADWLRNVREVERFARLRGEVFEEQMRTFFLETGEIPGTAFRR